MPRPVMLKKLKLNGSMKTYKTFLELTLKKDILFIIGDWKGLLSHKERNFAICSNMDGPRNYHTKCSKSDKDSEILYITYMWNLKNTAN